MENLITLVAVDAVFFVLLPLAYWAERTGYAGWAKWTARLDRAVDLCTGAALGAVLGVVGLAFSIAVPVLLVRAFLFLVLG